MLSHWEPGKGMGHQSEPHQTSVLSAVARGESEICNLIASLSLLLLYPYDLDPSV